MMSAPPQTAWSVREIGPEWDAEWDALASRTVESGFMQSSAWMAFKKAEGFLTLRVGLFENDRLGGGAVLIHYPAAGKEGFVLCAEGPVLPWNDTPRARAGLRAVISVAQDLVEKQGGLGLRIEPHLTPPAPSLLRNWSRAPVDLTPIHTLLIDLTLSDETLLSQMHPKGRYNLGVSQRHGVEVVRSTSLAELSAFYPLFQETSARNGFFAEPYGFFLNLGAALFPSGQAELFLARWEGRILSGILVVYYGGRATYLYGGSSGADRHVMPNYALQWKAIQASRNRGCTEYDLYGYEPFGLPDHLYAGISRFKRQCGGFRRDFIGGHDLIFYDRLADRLVDQLNEK
jgi:peptidoglycan pentaglycine glycine transferase (the first glycine)